MQAVSPVPSAMTLRAWIAPLLKQFDDRVFVVGGVHPDVGAVLGKEGAEDGRAVQVEVVVRGKGRVRRVNGGAKVVIVGTIPDAVGAELIDHEVGRDMVVGIDG